MSLAKEPQAPRLSGPNGLNLGSQILTSLISTDFESTFVNVGYEGYGNKTLILAVYKLCVI